MWLSLPLTVAGRPLTVEYSPVTDFREAVCKQFEQNVCRRGGYCNFMHIKELTKKGRKVHSLGFLWLCLPLVSPRALIRLSVSWGVLAPRTPAGTQRPRTSIWKPSTGAHPIVVQYRLTCLGNGSAQKQLERVAVVPPIWPRVGSEPTRLVTTTATDAATTGIGTTEAGTGIGGMTAIVTAETTVAIAGTTGTIAETTVAPAETTATIAETTVIVAIAIADVMLLQLLPEMHLLLPMLRRRCHLPSPQQLNPQYPRLPNPRLPNPTPLLPLRQLPSKVLGLW